MKKTPPSIPLPPSEEENWQEQSDTGIVDHVIKEKEIVMLFEEEEYDPIKTLMRAMILKAINDFLGPIAFPNFPRKDFSSANHYLFKEPEDTEYVFTFENCCQHIKICPIKLRKKILTIYTDRDMKFIEALNKRHSTLIAIIGKHGDYSCNQ